ncbi:Nudcd2 [Symbiodinium sp. KB8]|nr:Nudcd2 [Symbiodinium sp. KB8]
MYIQPPPGTPSKAIECIIRPESMRLGLKGNPPFLSAEFSSVVVASESFWMICEHRVPGPDAVGCCADGLLTVNLQKARKGETWAAVFKGHAQLDELSVGEERKALMLERFQAEHAGFDFSGAEFSGAAPDPQTFMGGVHGARRP